MSLTGRRSRTAATLVVAVCSIVVWLVAAVPANATITNVFSNTANPIPCAVQGTGVRLCDQTIAGNPGGTARSTVPAFDGAPIDVRVAFPPEPAAGPDGPYPLIMLFHGYAGSKLSLANMQPFLNKGYATLSMTTRGFGQSCGTATSRTELGAACTNGYVRLMDTRYEVRDAQELAGQLADESRTSFTQIGAIGGSYGGGLSMSLAALKNRKMLPDGSLTAWQSPNGTPMSIAAATPEIPWTDLPNSLVPNGGTLDYVADAPYQGRTGVLKSSWENGLYNSGLSFFYAAAGLDPDADLRNWHTAFNAGEPYDDASGTPNATFADIRDELTTHHSSYYIDHSQAPAPSLISSGWTDDLFPADEAIRFYNRTKSQYPNADIALFFASLGHQRGQNKAADLAVRTAQELAWFDYYVKGEGSVPFHGVTGIPTVCPTSAASGAPVQSTDWAHYAPGEIRINGVDPKTILPTAGSTAIAAPFDPLTGPGACATSSATDQADTATYRSDPVPTGGYTLGGAATVVADITSAGSNSQIAARLLDVDPVANTQALVERGLWRPAISATPVHQVFQLHPNTYKFAAGHIAKLELLPKDSNTAAGNSYGRTSNGQQNVTVENLELRLPVLDAPGSLGGVVQSPADKVVPPGYQLARDYMANTAYPRPKGATPLYVSLVPAFKECTAPNAEHGPPLSFGSCSPATQASDYLTVGTFDSNGQPAKSAGAVVLKTLMGDPNTVADEADVSIDVSLTDVRQKSDLSDYAGELQAVTSVQLTDGLSGPFTNEPGTVASFDLPVSVPCAETPDTTVGSTCAASTTFDALVPGSAVEGSRSVWQLGEVQVNDGGADGVAATADNTLFEHQGVFTP
jgi:predicted acyl esterase